MDLLIRICLPVPDGYYQHEKLRVLLRNLGKHLNHVRRPGSPRVLLGISQSVEPGLELIENERCRLLLEKLHDQVRWGYVCLLRSQALPLAANEISMWVAFEQKVPEKLILLPVQALADDEHTVAHRQVRNLIVLDTVSPIEKPLFRGRPIGKGVVQNAHNVRFALTPLTDEDKRKPPSRTDGLDRFEHVACRVGYLEEVTCRDLRSTGLLLIGQLDRRAFQPPSLEFLAQGESQHSYAPVKSVPLISQNSDLSSPGGSLRVHSLSRVI